MCATCSTWKLCQRKETRESVWSVLLFIRERSEGHRASRAQFLDSLSLVVMLDPAQNARKETFRPINDQRQWRTRPLFDLFGGWRKERKKGGDKKKEKEKKKRKKFEKRENNQREHESSPRMSSQTETWFNFVLGVGWLTFFLAHLTFPGQSSLLLAEHCVLEASSVDLIYLSKLEYR